MLRCRSHFSSKWRRHCRHNQNRNRTGVRRAICDFEKRKMPNRRIARLTPVLMKPLNYRILSAASNNITIGAFLNWITQR